MERSLRVGNTTYSCPARSLAELRDNAAISAECALYVYMSSIHELRRSGLGPWEATCSRSERFALRSNHQPIFREACSANACAKSLTYRFNQEDETLTVALEGKCAATRVDFQLIKKAAGKNQDPNRNNVTTANLQNSQAVFSYKGVQEQGFDAVRVILYQDNREVYRTNPSLDLPIPAE